jgi:hypothetical protein
MAAGDQIESSTSRYAAATKSLFLDSFLAKFSAATSNARRVALQAIDIAAF